MNNLSINLCILDIIKCKSYCSTFQKEVIISSVTTSICLNNDYILNIIRANDTLFTILIQNGINTYIRNIYYNETLEICIPCNNGKRLITICGNINE